MVMHRPLRGIMKNVTVFAGDRHVSVQPEEEVAALAANRGRRSAPTLEWPSPSCCRTAPRPRCPE